MLHTPADTNFWGKTKIFRVHFNSHLFQFEGTCLKSLFPQCKKLYGKYLWRVETLEITQTTSFPLVCVDLSDLPSIIFSANLPA